jgi:hypothetical protein
MHEHRHEDEASTHGMLLFGERTAYLSHLPMFSSPHNYQAIFEVTLSKEEAYTNDREAHPEFKMYSLVPTERFVLTDLVTFTSSGSPHTPQPLRSSFSGNIFRGHFETFHIHEKPESVPPKPVPGLDDVVAQVTNVVIFRQLDTYAQAPPLLPQLEYFLFGKGQELFLTHVISQSPDFDQVLGVQVDDHQFTDDELRRGVLVTFPERTNSESQRIQEQEQVLGEVRAPGHSGSQPLAVQLKAGTEFYFETDDLESTPVHMQQMEM